MLTFKKVQYVPFSYSGLVVLVGDIGGTNSNFGIFDLTATQLRLLVSLHFKSQEITDFPGVVDDVLTYIKSLYNISIKYACIGSAGIVYNQGAYSRPTNLSFTIDAHEIKQRTNIETLFLINDFEAVSLGIDKLAPEDIVVINHGTRYELAHQACIGAGTGLGKSIMVWDRHLQRYITIASEGGHADCAFQTEQEFALGQFIQKTEKRVARISWEDILSGKGIQRIYTFLGVYHEKKYPITPITQHIAEFNFAPDKISYYAQQDERCKDTFLLYLTFYARCGKNFVLDTLALNGLYIAGGIAARNVNMFFHPLFREEFLKCNKHREMLTKIPIYVIADYNVSLYGAAQYILLQLQQQRIVL